MLLIPSFLACQAEAPPFSSRFLQGTIPSSVSIPLDVQRLAILYPRTSSREISEAYTRLEGATFRLKAERPSLRIVDRFHLPVVLGEQRFQLTQAVSDDTAVGLGRVLGVDSVLIYRIEGPTTRERMWARRYSDLPPIIVMSKIIRVESAEVIFYNIVTSPVEDADNVGWSLADAPDFQRVSRVALERGIAQTVLDLQQAFK